MIKYKSCFLILRQTRPQPIYLQFMRIISMHISSINSSSIACSTQAKIQRNFFPWSQFRCFDENSIYDNSTLLMIINTSKSKWQLNVFIMDWLSCKTLSAIACDDSFSQRKVSNQKNNIADNHFQFHFFSWLKLFIYLFIYFGSNLLLFYILKMF